MLTKSFLKTPLLSFFLLLVFCIPAYAETPQVQTFLSSDKSCSLSAPNTWSIRSDSSSSAELMISAPGELYTNVWVEPKEDFVEMDLKKFSRERLEEILKNLGAPTHSEPTPITIGKMKGEQYEIIGSSGNLNIGYVYTLIEGEKYYYRILQWTLKSKFDSRLPIFRDMMNSFQGK